MKKSQQLFLQFSIIFFILYQSSGSKDKISVLHFQESGKPNMEDYAIYKMKVPTLSGFTVCYRLYAYFYRKENVIMSYALDDNDWNVIRLDHTRQGFRMIMVGALNVSHELLPLRKWRHYCFGLNLTTKSWFMSIQGKITARQECDDRLAENVIQGGGVFILGQEQDILGGGFQAEQSLSGALSELQLWNYTLEEHTISDIAAMKSELQGNVISWREAKWKLFGSVRKSYMKSSELLSTHLRYVILAKRRTFREASQLCQNLQGRIAAPISSEENQQLYNYSQLYHSSCINNIGDDYLWIGYTDDRREGLWENSAGQIMQYKGSWSYHEPNGEREENCASLRHGSALWNDITCSRALMCSVCQFDRQVIISILGLCERSGLDSNYLLAGEVNGRPWFAGNSTSLIRWDSKRSKWVLESLWNKQTFGVMQATDEEGAILPIGTSFWSFSMQLCPDMPKNIELTVTACGPGYYTCSDGLCVPIEQRCDRRKNCADHSDEANCKILGYSKGYRDEIPPANHHNKSMALPVFVWVDIIALTSLTTIQMVFDVDFTLKMAWNDQRLSYYNLKDKVDLNNLDEEERASIWTPALSFKSARGNCHTILDAEARMHVLKVGKPLQPSSSFVHEVALFDGKEAPLLLERKYHVRYGCAFNLRRYPFDTQSCAMEFESQFTTNSHVALKPGYARFLGRRQLHEYAVGDVSMKKVQQNSSFSGLEVRLTFIRQSGYHLVATYLPTSIMIAIAYLTFYFRVEDFSDRIMVSLTSLLVLSSLLTQTSETLPKTSYFKMVDIWLFFCIVTIFTVILIHTASICVDSQFGEDAEGTVKDLLEYDTTSISSAFQRTRDSHSGRSREGIGEKKLHELMVFSLNLTPTDILTIGKICVPIAVGIFNITYWIIALVN